MFLNDELGHPNFREIAVTVNDTVIIMHAHVKITGTKSGIVALKRTDLFLYQVYYHVSSLILFMTETSSFLLRLMCLKGNVCDPMIRFESILCVMLPYGENVKSVNFNVPCNFQYIKIFYCARNLIGYVPH